MLCISKYSLSKTTLCVLAELLHEFNSILQDMQILQLQHMEFFTVPWLLLFWVNNAPITVLTESKLTPRKLQIFYLL